MRGFVGPACWVSAPGEKFGMCGRQQQGAVCAAAEEVLSCSMCDITFEAGVVCQTSPLIRFGFSRVERDAREGLTYWRMLKV